MGDVLRTTPLLTKLKKKYPASVITWLVDEICRPVLEKNPLIDELLTYSEVNLSKLRSEHFDLSVNLDKEIEALDAVMTIPSDKRMGFGLNADGKLGALDPLSDYAYQLGIDDELKFKKNKKTYQEISFEQLGFRFQKEEYIFSIDPKIVEWAKRHLKSLGVDTEKNDRPIVGLNTGSGVRFAGKRLPISTYLALIEKFYTQMNAVIFILGGKDEIGRNREITSLSKYPVIDTGSHSIYEFAAIVQECDLVLSGDTTAMHIAIATKVPVVAHFASTCASEIELYGRGAKVISGISCAPCYKKTCPIDEQCMKDMSAEELFEAAKELLGNRVKC